MGVLGLVFVAMIFIFWILSQPSRIERLVRSAMISRNPQDLVEELLLRPQELQGRALNQMMERLWEESEFVLAIQLVENYVRKEKKTAAGHRWVKEALNREPVLSQQHFGTDFLEQFYNPNMAAHCAPGG